MANLRILYVGQLTPGTTCFQRMQALAELGCKVEGISTEAHVPFSLWHRLLYKLRGPRDLAGANQLITDKVAGQQFDILWLDKGLTIKPATLKRVQEEQPGCRIVGYSPDDMSGAHNQSRHFLNGLPYYTIFFTTKSYGVAELRALGCAEVAFVANAYDPATHQPLPVSAGTRSKFGGPVGFIGTYEKSRARSIKYLADRGIGVRVWGNDWSRCEFRHELIRIEGRAVVGEEYALATCAFDINLCFLRKLNRDLQTTRSVEIPACGAFMLAERTAEHQALLEEGTEAAYFDSDEELLEKVRYFSSHANERLRIAAAGRARCLRSGYSNKERLRHMLGLVERSAL